MGRPYNSVKYSEYEISQIQRKIEREIRAAKREKVAYQVAVSESDGELRGVMQEALKYSNSLVRDKQAKMRDFINQTGEQRQYFREQNYGRVGYSSSGIKYYSKFTENLVELNNGQKDVIKFRNIEKELNKTPIGKEILMYLEKNPVEIRLYYNVDVSDDLLGEYDAFSEVINIYASNSKTISRTTEVIIHELTHRRYNIGGDLWSECVCRAQEYKQRYGRNDLTISELRAIIKEIKETYNTDGTWKWRDRE